MTKRNRYTPQQRELAVKMVLTQQKKCKERKDRYGIIPNVAKNLGIPVNTLKCWIKRAKKQTPPQKRGRPSLLSDTEMLVLKAFLNKCTDHDFAVTKPVMVELIRKLTNNRIMVSTAKESRWLSRVLNRLNWNFKKQSYQYSHPTEHEDSIKSELNSPEPYTQSTSSTASSPVSPSSFSVPSSTTASPISSPLISVTGHSSDKTKLENVDPTQLGFSLSMLSDGISQRDNVDSVGELDQSTQNTNAGVPDDDIDVMASVSSNPQVTADSEEIKMRADQLFWEITETKREFWKLAGIDGSPIPQPLAMHQPLMQPQSSLLDNNPHSGKQTLGTELDIGLGHQQDHTHNPFFLPVKHENEPVTQQFFNPMQMTSFNPTPSMHPFNQPLHLYYAQYMYSQPYMWGLQHHEDQHLDPTETCNELSHTMAGSSTSEHNHLGMNTTT